MPLSGKTEPTPFNVQQPYDSRFPRRNIAGDVGLSTRRSGAIKQKPPLRRANQGISASFGGSNKLSSKHRKQWETLPEVTDPPPTAVGRLFWAHQGCQTDDFLAFKEALEPLVKEMVNGAILGTFKHPPTLFMKCFNRSTAGCFRRPKISGRTRRVTKKGGTKQRTAKDRCLGETTEYRTSSKHSTAD